MKEVKSVIQLEVPKEIRERVREVRHAKELRGAAHIALYHAIHFQDGWVCEAARKLVHEVEEFLLRKIDVAGCDNCKRALPSYIANIDGQWKFLCFECFVVFKARGKINSDNVYVIDSIKYY